VQRAVILSDRDTLSIDKAWLQRGTADASGAPFVLSEWLLNQEREVIEAALEETRGRISGALGAAEYRGRSSKRESSVCGSTSTASEVRPSETWATKHVIPRPPARATSQCDVMNLALCPTEENFSKERPG
jgi:hypothetical protein